MTTPPLELLDWRIRETALDADSLGAVESVFALSNGHVGIRGTLDEMQPSSSRGTFIAGVFEHHPLSYPEEGYGMPQHGQSIIGVADGTPVHVQVDSVPLDLRDTPPHHHERVLDLRAGTLSRETQWSTPQGQRMRLRSTRLVSLVHRAVSALRWEIEALDRPARVSVRSELLVNGTPPEVHNDDPRVSEVLNRPFRAQLGGCHETGGFLVHRTGHSKIEVGAAVDHVLQLPDGATVRTECDDDQVVSTLIADLQPGQRISLVKFIGHASSSRQPPGDVHEQAVGAVDTARDLGWEGLLADQRRLLDAFWEDADVEIDGDPELQLALRFDLFHVLQATACVHHAPVGGKGLTGTGYSGHTFWDIEGFVLPAVTLLRPRDAARMLGWRSSKLDQARSRAQTLGLPGASFPWRTIDGQETSGYWPASTAAAHLNADISRAFRWWADATGHSLTEVGGVDVLVETARLWAGMLHRDHDGGAHLLGMTGPDEYTGVVDDNVFTNLMARWNLRAAAEACRSHPEDAERLAVTAKEPREWRELAEVIHIPYDAELGVHPANEGFTAYQEWDFSADPEAYPIQEHAHYAKIYRHQVIKQADLVQALWWRAEAFTPEQTARNLDYYERRTVRDSSLSASVQAVVCARTGHLDLAVAYLREAALTDVRDLQGDSHQGVHLASLAGAWLAVVCGLGGLHTQDEQLSLAPRLPRQLGRVAFRFRWHGRRLNVETTHRGTVVHLLDADAEPLELILDGETVTLAPQQPVTAPLTVDTPLLPAPVQPPGRAPKV